MSLVNIGRVAMNPRGAYDAGTAYSRLDVVTHNGSAWIALQTSTGQTPAESAYWEKLVDNGAQGAKGDRGDKGDKGDAGGGGIVAYQNDLGLKVTKHYNVWNQNKAQLASCYWTWVMRVDDKLENPLGKYYMWYSTDHAADTAQCIGMACSDSLTSGWTRYGVVHHHYSESLERYIGDETPSVIWDEENRLFLMFSHGDGDDYGESQTQYRCQSTDGITWTNPVKAFRNIDPLRVPGNLHNGYFMPFRFLGQLFGYSILGGGNNGGALHWSEDGGYTWFTDHRQLGRWCLKDNDQWLYPNHSTVVTLRGQAYLLGVQSNFASGTMEKMARIVLTPLSDLRTPFGKSYVVVDPANGDTTYESDNLRTFTAYCEGGKIYGYYNCKVGNNWYNNCVVIEPLETAATVVPPVIPVTPAITISAHPQSASVTVGSVSGSLSVTASASDGSSLSYQWYGNTTASNAGGTAIEGATSASMAIDTTLTAGSYYYYCIVTSATAGTATSSAATVTVSAAATPVITLSAQPADAIFMAGAVSGIVSVTASVTGGGTLSYQWYENTTDSNTGGTVISDATSAGMTLATTLSGCTKYYYCVVSSTGATSVSSDCAEIKVYAESGYLAQYDLTGEASAAAPATFADASGNGNTLTVNNITAYNWLGFLSIKETGQSLSMASVNLNGKTKYKLYFKFDAISTASSQRIFALLGMDVSLQIASSSTSGGACYRVETSLTTLGFTSPVDTTRVPAIDTRQAVRQLICEWVVDNDQITIMGSFRDESSVWYTTNAKTFTCTGFTAALAASGIMIGNRADGTRPANAPLISFYIAEVTAG